MEEKTTTKTTTKRAVTPKATTTKKAAAPKAAAKNEPVDKAAAPKEVTKKAAAPKAAAKKAAAPKDATQKAAAKKAAAPKAAEQGKVRILFAASEALPFAATGGLGEVIGSLPKAMNRQGGFDARVIMPYYKDQISAEYAAQFKSIGSIQVTLSWRSLYCGIFEYSHEGVTYYFIDNEYYFKRNGMYGFYDDGERYAFFSAAVVEVLHFIDFIPDILHSNDWQTALIPVYYKLYYKHHREGYGNVRTVFTIHNIEYQGKFNRDCIEDLFGISRQELHSLEFAGAINLLKAAMDYSDAITTVSPTYAEELLSPEHSHGLSEIIKWNQSKLTGIMNGIDYDSYNPASDPALFANYDASSLDKKTLNKLELQRMLDLTVDPNVPVVALISRLVTHKGLDLLKQIVHEVLKQDIQFVLLGTGDADFEGFFQYIARTYDKKFRAVIAYNKSLSRQIYAAADVFLMPSKSEPCGLSQMIASRYGTVPIVRETGGLFDSIKDCGDGKTGNGFTFAKYSGDDLAYALARAIGLYTDYRDIFESLRRRVMGIDFSWANSAAKYAEFYKKLVD